jgi:hypothetical protein
MGKGLIHPVRNSSGALTPTGIILKSNPVAEHRCNVSNGVNPGAEFNATTGLRELADKEGLPPFPFLSMIVKKEISYGSDEPHRPHNK